MFINSAITYRKRAISSFESLTAILRQQHPSTTFTMSSHSTTPAAAYRMPSSTLRVLTPTLGPTSFWSRFKRRLIELTTGEDYDPITGSFSYSMHNMDRTSRRSQRFGPLSYSQRHHLSLARRSSSFTTTMHPVPEEGEEDEGGGGTITHELTRSRSYAPAPIRNIA